VTTTIGSSPAAVVLGDFNGDGKLDVAEANGGSNNIGILFGNGDGTLQATTYYPAGLRAYGLAAGDFDNDGKLDAVSANRSSNNLTVLLNVGCL
jgi:hypothetical protein